MEKVVLSTGVVINKEAMHVNIQKLINQVYKLLPMKE